MTEASIISYRYSHRTKAFLRSTVQCSTLLMFGLILLGCISEPKINQTQTTSFQTNPKSSHEDIGSMQYTKVLYENFTGTFHYKNIKKNIRGYEYFLPAELFHQVFKRAMSIDAEQITIALEPGMRQWNGDRRNGTERAEWGFYAIDGTKLINRNRFIKLSYEFKLPKNSKNIFQNKRTMISQLKHDGGGYPGFSPAFAVYAHKGGAVTCVDYGLQKSVSSQKHNHTSLKYVAGGKKSEIDIYDGSWHKVDIIF